MDGEGSVLTLASGTGKPAGSVDRQPEFPGHGCRQTFLSSRCEVTVEVEVVASIGRLAELGHGIDDPDFEFCSDGGHHVLADCRRQQ